MVKLNLPEVTLRTRNMGAHTEVFDPLRRKFVILTEEEWVRQHLIQYLSVQKLVPATMMASERGLTVNKMPKRFDLLVFATDGKPLMIVECKAPHIPLNEEVFYQAARYNLTLQVKYLLISNGLEHHCLLVDYNTGETRFLEDIPIYNNL
jgi:hypothetical protein